MKNILILLLCFWNVSSAAMYTSEHLAKMIVEIDSVSRFGCVDGCVTCEKYKKMPSHKYSVKHSVELHLRVHLHDKRYFCEKCGYGIGQEVNFRRHLASCSHLSPCKYECSLCKKVVPNLDRHNLFHIEQVARWVVGIGAKPEFYDPRI